VGGQASSDRDWFGVAGLSLGAPVAGSVAVLDVRLDPCEPAGSVAGLGGVPGFWSSSRLRRWSVSGVGIRRLRGRISLAGTAGARHSIRLARNGRPC